MELETWGSGWPANNPCVQPGFIVDQTPACRPPKRCSCFPQTKRKLRTRAQRVASINEMLELRDRLRADVTQMEEACQASPEVSRSSAGRLWRLQNLCGKGDPPAALRWEAWGRGATTAARGCGTVGSLPSEPRPQL